MKRLSNEPRGRREVVSRFDGGRCAGARQAIASFIYRWVQSTLDRLSKKSDVASAMGNALGRRTIPW